MLLLQIQKLFNNTFSKLVIILLIFVFPLSLLAQNINGTIPSGLNANTAIPSSKPADSTPNEISQLNQEIEQKKQKIKEVEDKKKEIEQQLSLLQKQEYSVQNQISAVASQIEDTEFEIEKNIFLIEKQKLEIEKIANEVSLKQADIEAFQHRLSSLIRLIDEQDRISSLFILLSRDSFASYLDDVRSATDIQLEVQQTVKDLKFSKQELEKNKTDQVSIQKQLENDKLSAERNRETLSQQKNYQEKLLAESKERAVPFKDLLEEMRKEEDYANSQVVALEDAIRQKILNLNKGLISNKNVPLSWPVIQIELNIQTCKSYITCSAVFLDEDYYSIFSRKHFGIDIPVAQGTPVYAPADGYVVGVVQGFAGGGVGSLSILKIDHTDEQGIVTLLSTKYLHMSSIIVEYNQDKPQFIRKGQLLGYSGGLPGTKGSGTRAQSTGPHLHFEVLSSGVPVNPLMYLP